MKISVDLDGTLYAHREFFNLVFSLFQSAGHQVGILTGHNDDSQAHDLDKLMHMGIYPDFYLGRPVEYQPLNGSIFKRDMIREHSIDIHFDDLDYGNLTSTELFDEDEHARVRLIRMPKDREAAKRHGW